MRIHKSGLLFCCNEKSFFLHFFFAFRRGNLQSKLICWPVIEQLIVRQMKDERPVENSHIFEKKIIYYSYIVKSDLKHPTGATESLGSVGTPFFCFIFYIFLALCFFLKIKENKDKRTIFIHKKKFAPSTIS